MNPGFRTRYHLVSWSDAPACRAPICHFGVSDRSRSIGRSERHDVACAVTLAATVVAAGTTAQAVADITTAPAVTVTTTTVIDH